MRISFLLFYLLAGPLVIFTSGLTAERNEATAMAVLAFLAGAGPAVVHWRQSSPRGQLLVFLGACVSSLLGLVVLTFGLMLLALVVDRGQPYPAVKAVGSAWCFLLLFLAPLTGALLGQRSARKSS